nr:hypothetical protein HAGR004_01140 [Bdellovibrio sp. HAGR004]
MAKKKDQKTKSVNTKQSKSSEINPDLKSPEKTLKSRGTFWVNERENGKWRVLFQNWSGGKKQKPEQIPPAMYPELGLKPYPEMSVDEAKQAITDYNKIRKKDIKISQSQIRALKRIQEMKEYDKTIFPPQLVSEFVSRLRSRSEGKDRFKNRLVRNFEIVQEMCVELNLLPHDYEANLDKITAYFKDESRQYSVSYSEDILWVLNKWGHFYSRHRKTFFEPIGRLKNKTRKSIKSENIKKSGVRRESLPMTLELLKKLRGKIDMTKLEEVYKYNWVFISFVFGLRPSECDSVIKDKSILNINGITAIKAIQTKLSELEESEQIKRIPVICVEQEEALEYIKKGQAKRPSPKWIADYLKQSKTSPENYDLYCGRKGFVDFMLDKGQTLENISLWCGHKSVETSWKHYKDRNRIDFEDTDFTLEKYKKKKSG